MSNVIEFPQAELTVEDDLTIKNAYVDAIAEGFKEGISDGFIAIDFRKDEIPAIMLCGDFDGLASIGAIKLLESVILERVLENSTLL
jgi:hypothetical protein